jgi:hypothetical protein
VQAASAAEKGSRMRGIAFSVGLYTALDTRTARLSHAGEGLDAARRGKHGGSGRIQRQKFDIFNGFNRFDPPTADEAKVRGNDCLYAYRLAKGWTRPRLTTFNLC